MAESKMAIRKKYVVCCGAHKFTGTFVLCVAIVTTCNSMLCGYHLVVLNTPRQVIATELSMTYSMQGTPFSTEDYSNLEMISNLLFFLLGAAGSLFSGYIADRIGSKNAVWCSNLALISGSIFSSAAYKVPVLLSVGRAIAGFGCGMASCSASTYLAEISPRQSRGTVSSLLPLGMASGITLAQAMGLPSVLGTATGWPWLFGLAAVPALISLITLPVCAESARFLLLIKKDESGAKAALAKLFAADEADRQFSELQDELGSCVGGALSVLQLLMSKQTRTAMALSCALQVVQQLAGSTAVLMHCERMFSAAGLSAHWTPYAVLATGLVSLISLLPATVILERAGRRSVLFTSLAALILTLLALTLTLKFKDLHGSMPQLSVVCVLLFCAAFAIGLGPLPAVIPPELFRQEARSKAYGVAKLLNSLCMLVQGALYEHIANVLQHFVFLPFVAVLCLGTTYFYFCLPETRGRTFEQVQSALSKSAGRRDVVQSAATEMLV